MNGLTRSEVQEKLYLHARRVLTDKHVWDTAKVTKRKNRDIIFGQLRDTVDRGKFNGRNSLLWGLKVWLKDGHMDIQIDAEHAWILDPEKTMSRRLFIDYFWASVQEDEELMMRLALVEMSEGGKLVGMRFSFV